MSFLGLYLTYFLATPLKGMCSNNSLGVSNWAFHRQQWHP